MTPFLGQNGSKAFLVRGIVFQVSYVYALNHALYKRIHIRYYDNRDAYGKEGISISLQVEKTIGFYRPERIKGDVLRQSNNLMQEGGEVYVWDMPRMSRIDTLSLLHHTIIRRIDRRKVLNDNRDREDFVERISVLLAKIQCYTWIFMTNHAHFLFRIDTFSSELRCSKR